MRAFTVAVAASIVAHVGVTIWLCPSAESAAEIVATDSADDGDDDKDVSSAEPEPEHEMAVELLDEMPTPPAIAISIPTTSPAAQPADLTRPASGTPLRTTSASPVDAASTVRAPDSTVRAADSIVRDVDSTVRAADSIVRDADSTVRAADSTVRAPDAGSRSKLMAMRGANLALSVDAVDAILARPRTSDARAKESPDPPDEAAELHHQIAELENRLADPAHEKYASEDKIDGEREDLESKKKDLAQMTIHPTGGGRYRSEPPASSPTAWSASIERDGTTHLEDAPNFQFHGFLSTFDLTDWAMRDRGDDPYSRAKMRFLDRTRPQRVEIGKRYRAEQLAHAPQLMKANVDRAWANILDPAGRKQALFDLWDDCAETGEAAVVDAGAAARAFVLGVIRARVSYTAAELARLNAQRRSTARFEP